MLPLPLLLSAACDIGMFMSATSIAAYLIRKRRAGKVKPARASPALRAVRDRARVWAENYTDMHPADFRRAYGVDRETFDYIMGKVDHDLTSKYPQYSRQGLTVTSGMKVAMALRWLRTDRDSALECIFKVGRCVRRAAGESVGRCAAGVYCSPFALVATVRRVWTCRRVRPRAARAAHASSTPAPTPSARALLARVRRPACCRSLARARIRPRAPLPHRTTAQKSVQQALDAIVRNCGDVIKFPRTEAERARVADGFRERWSVGGGVYYGCIACLDGLAVRVREPIQPVGVPPLHPGLVPYAE